MDNQSEEELGYEMQSLSHEAQREQMLSELQEGNRNLKERIKELEEEKKSQDEHIKLLNQCDDSSTEVIGKMDKELEIKDKRIEELEEGISLYIILIHRRQFTPPEIITKIGEVLKIEGEVLKIEISEGYLISSLISQFENYLKGGK